MYPQADGDDMEHRGAVGFVSSPLSRQQVVETRPVVTLIMDLDVQDGATLDKYFQFIYERGTTMLGMWQLIKEHVVEVRTAIVWLLVGNSDSDFSPLESHESTQETD